MKTINISKEIHKMLKAYCIKTGCKIQSVSEKALVAWISKTTPTKNDILHQVETYDAQQVHRRKNNLCLRCGRPERVNRWHCEQCHEETKE